MKKATMVQNWGTMKTLKTQKIYVALFTMLGDTNLGALYCFLLSYREYLKTMMFYYDFIPLSF